MSHATLRPGTAEQNPLLVTHLTAAKPVPPLPVDPALPQLAEVLNGQAMQVALGDAGINDVEEARPRYVRYKPGNKAIVLYDVRLSGRRCVAVITASARRTLAKVCQRPDVRELADLVRQRTPGRTPMVFLNALSALVEWFPLNRLIPGLALSSACLAGRLPRSDRQSAMVAEPFPLTYKPERRAVLGWGRFVVKAYARRSDFDQAVHGFAAAKGAPGLTVPPLVAVLPESMVTLQMSVAGTRPDDSRTEELGRALAKLHAAAVNSPFRTTPEDHLAAATETCHHVGFLRPALRPELERLLGKLESERPEPCALVQCHGDFHADQALVSAQQLALIDFDHACASHPALDLATFAAHLLDGTETSLNSALAALDELLRGYGGAPRDLDWFLAVGILRRASLPFRSLAPDWPVRVAGLIRAAAAVVSSYRRMEAL